MSDSPRIRGLLPAALTPFGDSGAPDPIVFAEQLRRLVAHGACGVIVLGSLGEGSVLREDEKREITECAVRAIGDHAPVIATVASVRTEDAIAFARTAQASGATGLMAMPPYVYRGDARETETHLLRVLRATDLPAIVYNNPIAYGTDLTVEQLARLVEEVPEIVAVKESSGDVRRITALRAALPARVDVLVGVDDLLLEGMAAGASGWVAGLPNVLPAECEALYGATAAGGADRATELYRWLLPLLRLDSSPKFVQWFKFLQAELGQGNGSVRPPRLPLQPEEAARGRRLLRALRESPPPSQPPGPRFAPGDPTSDLPFPSVA